MAIQRDYIKRHKQIVAKLKKVQNKCGCGCFSVSPIAKHVPDMDSRTIRAHLQIMEVDGVINFIDPDKRAFCTREGMKVMAEAMGYKAQEEKQG